MKRNERITKLETTILNAVFNALLKVPIVIISNSSDDVSLD